MLRVLKISGSQIDEPGYVQRLAQVVAGLASPTVIVHGGGKEINQLQTAFGITPRRIDGLRVSDAESLALVKMVLCGAVNPRIVEALQLAGVEAQGLSGVDRGLISATKLIHPKGDLERVGEAQHVRADILQGLIASGVTPVIAPICLGADGAFNVNADHVAGAVGVALGADDVIFLTDVPGVLQDGVLLETLTAAQSQHLIASEVITGGMIPKVETALHVVAMGAKNVWITNLDGLAHQHGTIIKGEANAECH